MCLHMVYGTQCSNECLATMKRIFKHLRHVIAECEKAKIEERKVKGLISAMEARKEKAKVRKRQLK